MNTSTQCYLNCGGSYKPLFIKRGHQYLKCSNCGLATLSFDGEYDQFIKKYYQQGYFQGGSDYTGYKDYMMEKECIIRNFRGYLHTISKHVNSGSHLDVGCAAGYFVELMQQHGFDSYGTDVSEFIINQSSPYIRHKLHNAPFHATNYKKGSFDLITMFDIIEHLSEPSKELAISRDLLKDKGYIFIVTGNIRSLYAKFLGKYNHFFAGPHHLMLFDHQTIKEILKQNGFKTINISSKGKWVSFEYMLQIAGLSLPLLESLLKTPVILSKLQNKHLYFHMGDTMMVTAQKM